MNEIVLTGWKPVLNKVALSKLLRDQASLSLSEAKNSVDSILDDQSVTIRIESDELAEYIFKEALELGVIGKLIKL